MTDIEIFLTKSSNESPEGPKNILLKFQPDVAREWKIKFDEEKHRCPAIIARPVTVQSTTVTVL